MRKFKVLRKWPGGPEVGSIWEAMDGYISSGTTIRPVSIEECEGYMEEVNEPEGFWYLDIQGEAVYYVPNNIMDERQLVPECLRFKTKQDAVDLFSSIKSYYEAKDDFDREDCGGYVVDSLNRKK